MKASSWIAVVASAVISTACAPTIAPPPDRQLAETRAAVRVAEEVGAPRQPQASMYFAVARQQVVEANREMSMNNHERAARLLMAAQANAELAAALAREASARADATQMRRQVDQIRARVP